jgi:hypothetical protein
MRNKGNFRNMKMYMEEDDDGWDKYSSRSKEKFTINIELKLDNICFLMKCAVLRTYRAGEWLCLRNQAENGV